MSGAIGLLGSQAGDLSDEFQRAYLRWLWHDLKGIGYIDAPLSQPPARTAKGYRLAGHLASLELLSRFPQWPHVAESFTEWLWQQRDENGLWDFGPATRMGLEGEMSGEGMK